MIKRSGDKKWELGKLWFILTPVLPSIKKEAEKWCYKSGLLTTKHIVTCWNSQLHTHHKSGLLTTQGRGRQS